MNVNVILLDLPCSVRAFTKKHAEGYTIVLNARLNRETNQKSLEHELKHIRLNHLDTEINVQEIECMLHAI